MSGKTPEWIRAELIKLGLSQAAWARSKGLHPRAVQRCISNHAPSKGCSPKRIESRLIMKLLSETLGIDLLGGNQ